MRTKSLAINISICATALLSSPSWAISNERLASDAKYIINNQEVIPVERVVPVTKPGKLKRILKKARVAIAKSVSLSTFPIRHPFRFAKACETKGVLAAGNIVLMGLALGAYL